LIDDPDVAMPVQDSPVPQDTSQICGIEHGGIQDANNEKLDANSEEQDVQSL